MEVSVMEVYILLGFVLILSIYLGLELISKVPSTLHTPLMSGANAISGIALVGALSLSPSSQLQEILAFLAVTFASTSKIVRLFFWIFFLFCAGVAICFPYFTDEIFYFF